MADTESMERTETILTNEQQKLVDWIRTELPLQARAKVVEEAELLYHTVSWYTARRRIARSLPWRPFRFRRVQIWEVADYPHFIPDAALLKLAEAKRTGLFDSFWVAEPTYERVQTIRQDPWLIGLRERDTLPLFLLTRMSIIAFWS